jgi:hypothetical protein
MRTPAAKTFLALVVLLAAASAGCRKKASEPAAGGGREPSPAPTRTTEQQKPAPAKGPRQPPAQSSREGDIDAIAEIYAIYCSEKGRPPESVADLASLRYREDRRELYEWLIEKIREGDYVVQWGVDLTRETGQARSILAYEKDTPSKGGLVRLLGGSVEMMSPEKFAGWPKAKPVGK